MNISNVTQKNLLPNFLNHKKDIKKVFDLSKQPSINNITSLDHLFIKCPICLKDYLEVYRPNCCTHWFCKICISIWTECKKECPYFRQKFSYLISK